MLTGEVPKVYLDANVTPLFKKGFRTDPSNYRPISLTSFICEILKKLVKKELLAYLTNHGLLCNQHRGFVPHKSCTINLLESIDALTHLKAKKLQADMVFLDLSKAIDKVHHPSLLEKLSKNGIAGNFLKWLGTFLSKGRKKNRSGRGPLRLDLIHEWCSSRIGIRANTIRLLHKRPSRC